MYHRSSASQQEQAVPVITHVVFSIYRANVELICDKSSEKKRRTTLSKQNLCYYIAYSSINSSFNYSSILYN